MRVALICAVLANINRDPHKTKAYKPEDFMPKKPEEPHIEKGPLTREQILSQQLEIIRVSNAMLGGKEVTNG